MKIKEYFTSTNTRSVKVRTNILWSMILKGISVGISFLLVPLTLHYLDTMQYGIWLTLSTILTWINLFDIGLSNGLRNKLAESLATGDREKARIYVSTTFAILTIIMGICFVLFLLVNNWLDWSRLLNAPSEMKNELGITAVIVICFFCLQFIFKFIGIILLADQRSALNDSLGVIAALFSYIIIWVMTRTVEPSLIKVAAAFSATPVIALVLAYPVVFKHYDYLKPKFSAVKFEYTGELLGLGVQFFLLQISSIIVFSTSNIIISHMFGPAEVTPYNIAFKYFTAITLLFNILLTPLWSACTEAFCKSDFEWIKNTIKVMIKAWAVLVVVTLIMIACSNIAYRFWVGSSINISMLLTVLTGLYVSIANWNNIFVQMIAGASKIRLMVYSATVNTFIFIPIAIYCGRYLGISGIMLTMCIVLLPSSIWSPVQVRRILNNRATGIWNK